MKANLFIVGAPRCGTSFLAYHLNKHPEIFFLLSTEPLYFAEDISFLNHRITSLEEYEALFSGVNCKWAGEKSPEYLYSDVAYLKIKDYCPNAKIIIMLRDPIDFICSWHQHNSNSIWGIKDNIDDVNEAILAEEERKEKSNGKYQIYFYKEFANYYKYVKRYLDFFGKENIKIVLLEDIKKDSKKVYLEVLKFLDLEEFVPAFKIVNPGTADQKSFLIKTIFFLKKSKIGSLCTFLISLLPMELRFFARDAYRVQTKKNIKPELEKKIRKDLEPDIKRLEKLINKDLSSWKKMSKAQ